MLCNGVVVFDDLGALLPDGGVVTAAPRALPAPALIAASSLALAGRELGRLYDPSLPEHRQRKAETLRGTGTSARSA